MDPAPARLERVWDVLLGLLTVANVGWTTLCLGGYRPETLAVSAPLLLVTLALVWTRQVVERARRGWVPVLVAWPLPFLIYAVGNTMIVSPVRWLGWQDVVLWLQLAAAYWIGLDLWRRRDSRRILLGGLGLLVVVAVGLAVYQRLVDPQWLPMNRRQAPQYLTRSGGPFGIPNSFAALLLLVIPPALAVALSRGFGRTLRGAAAGVATVALLGLGLTISRGAWLSLALTAMFAPLILPGWDWRRRVAGVALMAATALAAGLLLYRTVPAVRDRMVQFVEDRGERTRPLMWGMSWQLFQDEPVWGTGAGSYRVLLERHRPEAFRDTARWAHNDYLNTLSDYGVVGFTLSFGAAAAAAAWLWRRRAGPGGPARHLGVGLALGLVAFALSLWVDFHLKIPALAMVVGLVVAAWVALRQPPPESPGSAGWRLAAGTAAAVAVLIALLIRPPLAAEALRYAARQDLDALAGEGSPDRLRAALEPVIARLEAAVERDARLAPAWSDLALAVGLQAHHDRAGAAAHGRRAETAARQAVALSSVVPEFWIALGVALDLQGRWVEAGTCFSRALQLAPHQQLVWYYQAYHYSLKPATRPLARAAVATCLRLDPGNPAAEALAAQLANLP